MDLGFESSDKTDGGSTAKHLLRMSLDAVFRAARRPSPTLLPLAHLQQTTAAGSG